MGLFLGFVRQSGTTRAGGPHRGASYARGAKRNRIDRPSRVILPPLSRYTFATWEDRPFGLALGTSAKLHHVILDVADGSPAYGNVNVGTLDIINSINGVAVQGLAHADVLAKLTA